MAPGPRGRRFAVPGAGALVLAAPGPAPRFERHLAAPSWLRAVSEHVAAAEQSGAGGDAGRKACTCGHGKEAHQHYRKGTDCALCSCPRYDRPFSRRLGFRRSSS